MSEQFITCQVCEEGQLITADELHAGVHHESGWTYLSKGWVCPQCQAEKEAEDGNEARN